MKLLALEREVINIDWERETQSLIDEAKAVYQMMLSNSLREIYFTEYKNAVLILEFDNKIAAKNLLNKLPLVERKIIEFDLIELQPYSGFSRLMDRE